MGLGPADSPVLPRYVLGLTTENNILLVPAAAPDGTVALPTSEVSTR